MRTGWALFALVVLLSFARCAGTTSVRGERIEGYLWPPNDPRIRLERVIETRSVSALGSRLMRWLGDASEEASLFVRPHGIAWDGDALLVTDPGSHQIVRIGMEGDVTLSAAGDFTTPIGVTVCKGSILVTDSSAGKVAVLGDDLGVEKWLLEGLSRPTGIGCHMGSVILLETGKHRLTLVRADGGSRTWGERGAAPGQFNYPTALAADHDELWIGDTLNFRLQRVVFDGDRTLRFANSFGELGDAPGDMPRIKGVAVDASGHLWISDAHLDRVSIYEPEGGLLLSLGGTGQAPGAFAMPAGIAAHPDGRVAVVDSLNQRIQIFRLLTPIGLAAASGDDPETR